MISRTFTVEVVLDSLTGCQDASRLLVRKAGDGVLKTKLTLVDVASAKRFTGYAILNLISQEALKCQGAPPLGKPGLFEDHLSSSGNTLSDDLHHPFADRIPQLSKCFKSWSIVCIFCYGQLLHRRPWSADWGKVHTIRIMTIDDLLDLGSVT